MAINVDFKKKIGHCTLRDKNGVPTWKITFCEANCLTAMIYFYTDVQDGVKDKRARLNMFFADLKHAKKCVDAGVLNDYCRFNFYANKMSEDMWRLVRYMTEKGIKVTIK